MTEEAEDLSTILDWLDEKPSLSRHAGAVRRLDRLAAQQPDLFRTVRLGVVRNFTIETEEPLLRVAGYRAGLAVDVHYSGYDPSVSGGFTAIDEQPFDVLLVALRLEELAPDLASQFVGADAGSAAKLAAAAVDQVIAQVMTLRSQTGAPIFVHNFVAPLAPAGGLVDSQNPLGELNTVRRINLELTSAMADIDGAHIVDVDHLFATIGIRECIDQRGARSGDAPLSVVALRALAEAHVRHLLALRGSKAKCVVVDADNTLWGGVIGEDGIDGIALGETGAGRRHRNFQQHLIDLKQRGVVLALCSKNEMADAMLVLRDHPDCLLSEADFAAMRVNWQDKAENLLEIAAELNLGLEHLVFVDDNPVECDAIRQRLPTITVVQWPDDLGESGTLDELALFDSLTLTAEDRERSAMYRAEGERARAREAMPSVEEYLTSLEMVATIGSIGREHLARARATHATHQPVQPDDAALRSRRPRSPPRVGFSARAVARADRQIRAPRHCRVRPARARRGQNAHRHAAAQLPRARPRRGSGARQPPRYARPRRRGLHASR